MRTFRQYVYGELDCRTSIWKDDQTGKVKRGPLAPMASGTAFNEADVDRNYGVGASKNKGWPAGQYQHGNPRDFIHETLSRLAPDVTFHDAAGSWDVEDLKFVEGLYPKLRGMAGLPPIRLDQPDDGEPDKPAEPGEKPAEEPDAPAANVDTDRQAKALTALSKVREAAKELGPGKRAAIGRQLRTAEEFIRKPLA